jgi:hypothetical protein
VSMTGHWIVGPAEPGIVEALRSTVPTSAYSPLPDDAELTWWSAMDDAALAEPAERGYGNRCPTHSTVHFAEAIEAHRPDPEFRDGCVNAFASASDPEIFHVGVRKGDPVAALCYGLGFSAARRLPGRFGCFLLGATEVPSALHELATLVERPGPERQALSERCAAWLSVMADEPDLDPLILLNGPLSALRHASARGLGTIGVMQWY